MNTNVTPMSVAPAEKLRTITLTGRAPIQIKESEWPLVAEGWSGYEDNGCPITFNVKFKVRRGQHARMIIYATYGYWDEDSSYNQNIRVGRHVTAAYDHELWQHLREVGNELRERILYPEMKKHVTLALDNCFEKLAPRTY
jgi:hypothetical protein